MSMIKSIKAEVTVEMIGPQEAKAMLDTKYETQRPIADRFVLTLAREMAEGEWKLSPDCICLIAGQLANGQHRLSAVVKSGMACPFVIMRTPDKSVFDVTDQGRSRSMGVLAKQHGVAYYNDIASTVVKILVMKKWPDSWGGPTMTRKLGVERSAIVASIVKHKDILEELATWNINAAKGKRFISRTIGLSLLFLAHEKGELENAKKFLSEVYGLAASTSPVSLLLHNRLVENAIEGSQHSERLPVRTIMAFTVKAYVAWRDKRDLRIIKMVDNELMPKI